MPQDITSALYRAACDAAARGWRVFPLAQGGKRPAVRSWEQRATADPERIARCWATGAYNIGIATGPSRLVVVDLDTAKGEDDRPPAAWDRPGIACGEDVLGLLADEHGQPYPHDTYTVRTGSGGTHLYFVAPEGIELRNTAGKLGWKVDTRAVGGYVVAAGSALPDGRAYEVLHDAAPAPLPVWLAGLLVPAPLPPQKPVMVPLTAADRRGRYVAAAVNAELERIAHAPRGQRNIAVYRASVALGQLVAGGALEEHQAVAHLTEAAHRVGQGERETAATIASGLRAGAKRPREVAA